MICLPWRREGTAQPSLMLVFPALLWRCKTGLSGRFGRPCADTAYETSTGVRRSEDFGSAGYERQRVHVDRIERRHASPVSNTWIRAFSMRAPPDRNGIEDGQAEAAVPSGPLVERRAASISAGGFDRALARGEYQREAADRQDGLTSDLAGNFDLRVRIQLRAGCDQQAGARRFSPTASINAARRATLLGVDSRGPGAL